MYNVINYCFTHVNDWQASTVRAISIKSVDRIMPGIIKIITNIATGVAPITVATSGGGENCIVVVPGANYELTASDLTKELFQNGKIIVCQNELHHETTQRALELGKNMGLTTVYSPAPCPTISEFKSIASNLDFVLANESEALQLTGASDIETAATKINDFGVKHAIITLG